jgi:hypothetical protein
LRNEQDRKENQKDAERYRAFADFNGTPKEECKDEQEENDVLLIAAEHNDIYWGV